MANSRDFTGKNRKFTGTKGITTPKGTTEERVGSESGELRFNTTTELMEYFDGNQWKPIDAPPTISSVTTNDATGSNIILNADGSTLYTITITGGNFGIGAVVKFIGSTGTEYTALSVNRVSGSSITCTTRSNMGTTDDPYDVQVTNASGLAALLEDAFSYNAPPVFVNASGQLGTVFNGQTISGTTLNAGATDAEGNTITYSIVSGSLPGSGLSLSSSTGAITGTLSGTPSLGNYPFVVRAATDEGFVERQFSIAVVVSPFIEATGGTVLTDGDFKTHVFTSPGTFTVTRAGTPLGSTTVEYLVVAGGGSGANGDVGGGAGAGGMRYNYPSPVTGGLPVSATSYPITVGSGGTGVTNSVRGNPGNPSVFSNITSTGGGGGGTSNAPPGDGKPGGSGGGAGWGPPTSGGSGNSPPTSPSQGNPGGNLPPSVADPAYIPGGGGGHAQAGFNGAPTTSGSQGGAGSGGNGTPISPVFFGPTAPSYGTPGPAPGRFFAGGGGASSDNNGDVGAAGGFGGGGKGGQGPAGPASVAGSTNTGGGSGGEATGGERSTNVGGSGIVAIRYKFT